MELLNKPGPRDLVAYVVAYVLLLLTGALAALTAYHLRLLVLAIAITGGANRWVYPLIDRLVFFLPIILWIVAMLWLEHSYRTAVTESRILNARSSEPRSRSERSPVMRYLARYNLNRLTRRFLIAFGSTLLILGLVTIGRRLVTVLRL